MIDFSNVDAGNIFFGGAESLGFRVGGLLQAFNEWVPLLKTMAALFSIACIAGIFFALIKIREVQNIEYHKYKPLDIEEQAAGNRKIQWEVVLDHVNSENPAEWKLAVLEADNILDGVLIELGYGGETLGDRLRGMEEGDLPSLQRAWDAHKIRNMIAHEESFPLSKRQARTTIQNYEEVLGELGYL